MTSADRAGGRSVAGSLADWDALGWEPLGWERVGPARRAVVSRWRSDPDTGGAYSHLRPGGSPADRRRLAEPLGPGLVLCGEATDVDFPATMHAAWRSGERAAAQLAGWRPEPGPGRAVVVGAGLAGLVAAGELRRAGWEVVVLEAAARAGGRATTDRTLGVPVHLAAGWVHGDVGNPVGDRLAALGVPTAEAPWERMAVHVVGRGRLSAAGERRVDAATSAIEEALDAVVAASEGGDLPLGPSLRRELAALASGDPALAHLAEAWLRTEYQNVYSGRLDDLSLRQRVEPYRMAGDDRTIVGPLDRLVEDLLGDLDVRYRSRVTTVAASPAGECAWAVELADGRVEPADAVVLAVPLGPLQSGRLRIDPPPVEVVEAWGRLGMGSVAKVVATFDRRFWTEGEAFLLVDDPFVALEVWVDVTPLCGVPALCAFATGDDADAVEQLDEPALCALVDDHLARLARLGPSRR